MRQARRFVRCHPARVRVCWDLDNTLVDSGSLLRSGRTLAEAVVEAYPVENMLSFYEEMQSALRGAEHFILSARTRDMKLATADWLERHGLATKPSSVCLIRNPASKPAIWRELALGGQLVIVDDLSFNHELEELELYHDLIAQARAIATCYIGVSEIKAIAADTAAVRPVAEGALAALQGVAASRGGLVSPQSG